MKKNIAVLTGGFSGEAVIAERSAAMVMNNIDRARFEPVLFRIEREQWTAEIEGERVDINKDDFSICAPSGRHFHPDCVFVMIHGTPGEDGILQGYLDLIGLPYTTGGVLNLAVTFNKAMTTMTLREKGFKVAKSAVVIANERIDLHRMVESLGLPCFVKPNRGGSSIGMSKVKTLEELQPAIDRALKEDSQVLIEQFMTGREITCGVIPWKGELLALPPTEIITENDFFDFAAKYQGQSREITPAEIPNKTTEQIQTLTKQIYRALDCRGMIRIDYKLFKDEPHIIEVNTVPGFSEASIVPQQAAAIGISKTEVISTLIDDALTLNS